MFTGSFKANWKSNLENEQESKIIQKLTKHLQEDLFYESNGKIFKTLKLFSSNFSEAFLKRLSCFIKEKQI